jgi:hypothetical protein
MVPPFPDLPTYDLLHPHLVGTDKSEEQES